MKVLSIGILLYFDLWFQLVRIREVDRLGSVCCVCVDMSWIFGIYSICDYFIFLGLKESFVCIVGWCYLVEV